MWGKLSGDLRKLSGVIFNWKTIRPTYANRLINKYGVSIGDVAQMLGHASTATTEKYYGRIELARAKDRIRLAYTATEQADKILPL
jgi:integrase